MNRQQVWEHVLGHAGSISQDLVLAAEAAKAAGEVILAGQEKLASGETAVEQKGVGDLVSQVDRDADMAATKILRSVSDLAILSEELHDDVAEQDDMWIVDPLDASSAYLMQAGVQYPAVLVALRRGGDTVLGVNYFPLTGEWFYAQKSRGAWRDGKRLISNSDESLSEIWVEMNQYGASEHETDYFSNLRNRLRSSSGAQLVTTNVPHSGVAVRIAQGLSSLAAAIHDNNPESVKQGVWDIAAPQIILEEAGGVFVNPEGHRTDPFTVEPIIVARTPEIAKHIIDLGRSLPVGS
ncbi:MAG: inositol monophosphatase family protein [Planctomycetota bacterium]